MRRGHWNFPATSNYLVGLSLIIYLNFALPGNDIHLYAFEGLTCTYMVFYCIVRSALHWLFIGISSVDLGPILELQIVCLTMRSDSFLNFFWSGVVLLVNSWCVTMSDNWFWHLSHGHILIFNRKCKFLLYLFNIILSICVFLWDIFVCMSQAELHYCEGAIPFFNVTFWGILSFMNAWMA